MRGISVMRGKNPKRLPRLKVFRQQGHPGSDRFLITEDGKPFFYLGDTAWELFHRLTREEATTYLQDRACKGFTVIQAVVLAELDGLNTPNAYGHTPLHRNDPTQPNEAYFEFVDFVVQKAEELGLYIGMLPTWGDKVNKKWGVGPEIFTPDNARIYGEFLGRRYRGKPIIWILGGDRPIENETHLAIWRAMADGLRKGDDGEHLITFHPVGGRSSSEWLHGEPWLDFNMLHSGHHARHIPNDEMVSRDYQRTPVKPCMDGEPPYEDHPINWDPRNGWFDDHDVREAAYWALLAGAHGHTYGCHDIWQFYDPAKKRQPVSHARTPWQVALQLPAAGQMQFARNLMLSRPMLLRVPDQQLVTEPGQGADRVRAARAADGSYAFIYLPRPRSIMVRLGKLSGKRFRIWAFNPRNGEAQLLDERERSDEISLLPPTNHDRERADWVFVIDDADQNFPPPGTPMP